MAPPGTYRKNVVAVIRDSRGQVLVCHSVKKTESPWQFPQGGIEEGETPEQAIQREIFEELGITSIRILARTEGWIRYEWPPEKRRGDDDHLGQEQIYFLIECDEKDLSRLAPTPDFLSFEWVTWQEAIQRVIPFKRGAYQQAHAQLCIYFE